MICQECQKRPATLHFTKIINGEKNEFHLCEHCASDKTDLMMFNRSHGLSINNLLAGLFNMNSTFQKEKQEQGIKEETIQCTHCGMTFPNFLKVGKFGCANCYDAFENKLAPILQRLHSGNGKHSGKIPKRTGGTFQLRKKIEILKETLRTVVLNEEFEKAAEIRDEIRSLERLLLEGGE